MNPDTVDILSRYQEIRESLQDAAKHWPALSAGSVTVDSETVNSMGALRDKLQALLDAPEHPDRPAGGWLGWWQTTDTVHAGEWPGCAMACGPGDSAVLDGEWAHAVGRSVQVRHIGGQWRVTCLEEVADGPQGMFCDVALQARPPYATVLTYRVYLGWDERRGRMAPHAARLREIHGTQPAVDA